MDKEITHKHIQWNIIQTLKEQNFAICNNINGPQRNYAKCNKSETQTPYDFFSFKCEI